MREKGFDIFNFETSSFLRKKLTNGKNLQYDMQAKHLSQSTLLDNAACNGNAENIKNVQDRLYCRREQCQQCVDHHLLVVLSGTRLKRCSGSDSGSY